MMTIRNLQAGHRSRAARLIPLVLLGLLLIPQGAPAHPPSDLQPAFDPVTRQLSVTITHPVADPAAHHVKQVLVTAGGTVVNDSSYVTQPVSTSFTYTYPVPPGVSGEVQVTAQCSVYGSLARSIMLPDGQPSASPPAGTPVPGQATPPMTPPRPPGGAPGTRGTPSLPAPATTEAAPGIFTLIAAIALAGWQLRR